MKSRSHTTIIEPSKLVDIDSFVLLLVALLFELAPREAPAMSWLKIGADEILLSHCMDWMNGALEPLFELPELELVLLNWDIEFALLEFELLPILLLKAD